MHWVAVVLSGFLLHAAPSKKRPSEPVAPPPAPATVPLPAAAEKPIDPTAPIDTLLDAARGFFSSLEYDRALPYAEVVLKRDDATLNQRVEAYFLQASARAFVSDPLDAERPLRFLLRLKPDYELPADTSPKLVAVFRKVQAEERALAVESRAVERSRVRVRMKLAGGPPERTKGGQPLDFRYQVVDPSGAVSQVRVSYRRDGQPDYSTLALERDAKGDWVASLPGEATASETATRLEYFTEASDASGVLVSSGGAQAPMGLFVEAGQVARAYKPVPRAVFGVSLAVALAAGVTSAVFGGLAYATQRSYDEIVASGMADGGKLKGLRMDGIRYSQVTNWAMGSTGVFAILTLVLSPFVDWSR